MGFGNLYGNPSNTCEMKGASLQIISNRVRSFDLMLVGCECRAESNYIIVIVIVTDYEKIM